VKAEVENDFAEEELKSEEERSVGDNSSPYNMDLKSREEGGGYSKKPTLRKNTSAVYYKPLKLPSFDAGGAHNHLR